MRKHNNNGLHIEDRVRRFFKGSAYPDDAVDFQTKKALWEVKSCNLFNSCVNSNHKRPGKSKKCKTHRLGRFYIKHENHRRLLECAVAENKEARYVFVVQAHKGVLIKVVPWDKMRPGLKGDVTFKSIFEIFGGDLK